MTGGPAWFSLAGVDTAEGFAAVLRSSGRLTAYQQQQLFEGDRSQLVLGKYTVLQPIGHWKPYLDMIDDAPKQQQE